MKATFKRLFLHVICVVLLSAVIQPAIATPTITNKATTVNLGVSGKPVIVRLQGTNLHEIVGARLLQKGREARSFKISVGKLSRDRRYRDLSLATIRPVQSGNYQLQLLYGNRSRPRALTIEPYRIQVRIVAAPPPRTAPQPIKRPPVTKRAPATVQSRRAIPRPPTPPKIVSTVEKRPTVAPAPAKEKAITSDQFQIEIEGLNPAPGAIRAVTIGNITVDLVATGITLGQENFSPARVRNGDLRITERGSKTLAGWESQMRQGSGQPRTIAVSVLSEGKPVLTYNFYNVRPLRMESGSNAGDQVLVSRYDAVEVNGAGVGTVSEPVTWEWEGVLLEQPLGWNESTVALKQAPGDKVDRQPVQAGSGNFWEFTVRTGGLHPEYLAVLKNYRVGDYQRRSQSRISRNKSGVETSRTNYYETFMTRYTFPRFDKDRVQGLSESVTFISPLVEQYTGDTVVKLLKGPPLVLRDPLLTSNFRLEIEGISLEDRHIRSVKIGDISADLISTGTYFGRENVSPGPIRFGDVTITSQGSNQLSQWFGSYQSGNPQRRSASIIMLDRGGEERARFNLYELAPAELRQGPGGSGIEILRCRAGMVELADDGGYPEPLDSHTLWEWEGVNLQSIIVASTDRTVAIQSAPNGPPTVQSVAPGQGNFQEFSVTTPGVHTGTLNMVRTMLQGSELRRSHSRIQRNTAGQETGRTNYYDTFLYRFSFPHFDKAATRIVGEKLTFLSPHAEYADGPKILVGFRPDTPMLTRDFSVEIEGINIPEEYVQSVTIGDISVPVILDGGGRKVPGQPQFGSFTIKTGGGLTQLSQWLNAFQSGNPERRAASVVLHRRDGGEAFRYNLYDLAPVNVLTTGAGNSRTETLTANVGFIEIPDASNSVGDLASLSLPEMARNRSFRFEMEGYQDSSSWESLQETDSGNDTNDVTLRLRGLVRPEPRGYIFNWVRTLHNNAGKPTFSAMLTSLGPDGQQVGNTPYSNVFLKRLVFPRMQKGESRAAYAEMHLHAEK